MSGGCCRLERRQPGHDKQLALYPCGCYSLWVTRLVMNANKMISAKHYQLRPFLPQDAEPISAMARHYLGENCGIAASRVMQLASKVPQAFQVAEYLGPSLAEGIVCGYYSLLPVHPDAARQLRQGSLPDYQLGSEHLLAFDHPQLRELYVMDVMTWQPGSKQRCRLAAARLLQGMHHQVGRLVRHNPALQSAFALPGGEASCRRIGFQQAGAANPQGWQCFEMSLQAYRDKASRQTTPRPAAAM